MIELFRVFFILIKWGLITRIGNKLLPRYIYHLAKFLEFLATPFSKKTKNLGNNLSKALEELGPIYIKFGQTLSSRPDLIGEEIALHLSKLQDKLPAFSSKTAIKIIEEELGNKIEDLFSEFNEVPIAAASIAQVHKGILKTGEKVAIKILRPSIEKEYKKDIKLLYFLSNILNHLLPEEYKRFKAKELVDVFDRSMHLELNMLMEAASCSEMKDNFNDDESIYIPEVFWAFTSKKILTISWVDGISIYDHKKLISQGFNLDDLSSKLAVMFFDQAFKYGFFHADLHPGNIFITKEGKIALIDFGITGKLSDIDRIGIAEILYAILNKDYLSVAKIHIKIGYLPKNTDIFLFAKHCRSICTPILNLAQKDISIGRLLEQLLKMSSDFNMPPQHQLFLLQKTMLVLEGIGKTLDPDINMWKLAEPWIKKWAIKNISPEAKLIRLVKKLFNELTNGVL